MQTSIHEIRVGKQAVNIKSSKSKEEVQAIVKFVNKKFRELTKSSQGISFQNAMILISLSLTEELFETKKQATNSLGQLEKKAQKIFSTLESSQIL
ncbi:MAG: cell division protein ZapA [Bdellovibrionaceae bacterium]|nr:cell division protein ZapA [Pseudobdellovibrionaceae bacterium]